MRKLAFLLLTVCILFSCFTVRADAADLNQLTYKTNSDGTITISSCDKNAEGELVIPDEIGGRAVTGIGHQAFYNCKYITKVTLPATLLKIDSAAFSGCAALKEVAVQDGVTEIGTSAFSGCSSLKSFTMPDTVTKIGYDVFKDCISLESAKWSNNLTILNSFKGCTSLKTITVPSKVEKIDLGAFQGSGLETIVIPANVKTIQYTAFQDCTSLVSVRLNEGLQEIGHNAFQNCTSLRTIAIPDTVNGILAYSTFRGCSSLKSVYIGSGITKMGGNDSAFRDCTSLQEVYLHANFRDIGPNTFNNCPALTDVYYRGTQEQWTSVAVKDGNDALLLADVHYTDSFTDVATAAWYGPAVYWAVGQGITSGVGNHAFAPSMTCTNGQVITFLWVAAGTPTPTGSSPFSKVQNSNAYYYRPAVWAYEKGIITDTNFDPDAPATRANFVTYLWRYKGKPSVSRSNPFTDVKSSDAYYTAVMWALENDITSGTSATTFSPAATCTRGQIVTFLYGYFAR